VLALHLGRVAGDLVAEVQRRIAGALCVVLVRDRRPEERHDAVARELVDEALEALDAFRQDAEEALHDLRPRFRVELLCKLHRALHVGEHHRHAEDASGSHDPPPRDGRSAVAVRRWKDDVRRDLGGDLTRAQETILEAVAQSWVILSRPSTTTSRARARSVTRKRQLIPVVLQRVRRLGSGARRGRSGA